MASMEVVMKANWVSALMCMAMLQEFECRLLFVNDLLNVEPQNDHSYPFNGDGNSLTDNFFFWYMNVTRNKESIVDLYTP